MIMEATFVIGFHSSRTDNLLQVMHFLTKDHFDLIKNCQIVTVCQDYLDFDKKTKLKNLTKNFSLINHIDLELSEMMLPLVTNTGISHAISDKVLLLESDRILPSGYFQSVVDQIKPKIMITCKNMKKLKKEFSNEDIESNKFDYKDEQRSELNKIGIKNMWSGNTAFWREDFYECGKMDENYVGYGWADSDMTNQMLKIGVQQIFTNDIELHLWHPNQTFGKKNQKKLFIDNGVRFYKKWNQEYNDWFKEEIVNFKKSLI